MVMKPHPSAMCLPQCSLVESRIVQLRAAGYSYPRISREVRLAPRKVWDTERAALTKILRYLESELFLNPMRK